VIKANGYLFGGYLSIPWKSDGAYHTDNNAFLFSLNNSAGTPPIKYANKNDTNHVYFNSSYGPTFGGGHDIHICDNPNLNSNSYSNFPTTYNGLPNRGNDTFAAAKHFVVTDYEVYARD